MIQDMLGNEFYVGAYKVILFICSRCCFDVLMCVKALSGIMKDGSTWKTTKFMDSSQCPAGFSPDMRIWERRLLYCVPVSFQ